MASDLIRTWRKHHKITMQLLDAVPAKSLADQYTDRTRTVAAQFAHIHYVRVRNIDHRGGKELAGTVEAFEKGAQPKKTELKKALRQSSKGMEKLLKAAEEAGSVKSWKGSLTSYLAYHVAHEAHHRALAIVCMRMAGNKIPQESVYGLWDAWRVEDPR